MVRRIAFAAAFAVLAIAGQQPGRAQTWVTLPQPERIDIAAHVHEASRRFGLPAHWIYAVIRIESAGRTRAVSSAGAMGLMQLMPGTWARQRARFSLGSDPFDPRDNILAGTSYLREMYDRYGAPGFLAAYNAGPGRYEQWRDRGRPLPRETRRYVAGIAPWLQQERIVVAAATERATTSIVDLGPSSATTALPMATGEHGALANPFARPAQPAHDLFAPVVTVGER